MMLWLAIEAWRNSGSGSRPIQLDSSSHRAFATGALINLLNPKAYIFFLVVAPQFLRGEALGIRTALILSLISVTIATTIHLAIVLAGSTAHAWLSDAARTRVVRRTFAVVMLMVAISFLIADLG